MRHAVCTTGARVWPKVRHARRQGVRGVVSRRDSISRRAHEPPVLHGTRGKLGDSHLGTYGCRLVVGGLQAGGRGVAGWWSWGCRLLEVVARARHHVRLGERVVDLEGVVVTVKRGDGTFKGEAPEVRLA